MARLLGGWVASLLGKATALPISPNYPASPQASVRMFPARGPFCDGSSSKMTRCPSFNWSKLPAFTELRWKNHSCPPSSRMNPKPRSRTSRLIVPFATSTNLRGPSPNGPVRWTSSSVPDRWLSGSVARQLGKLIRRSDPTTNNLTDSLSKEASPAVGTLEDTGGRLESKDLIGHG